MGDFTMPALGADMERGTLLEWLVAPGDEVHRGDVVAVVETPKAAVDVECFEDGVVSELTASPGDVVEVGGVLARIAAAGQPEPRPPTPVVRHRAAELGVDVTAVAGTGPDGRVTRGDVDRAAAAHDEQPAHDEQTQTAPDEQTVRAVPAGARARVSPLARRLAAEAGLDPAVLRATVGADGAVHAADVRRASAGRSAAADGATGVFHPPAASPSSPAARPATVLPGTAPTGAVGPAPTMRESIAALMTRANREIPHYHLSLAVDVHRGVEWMHERNRRLDVGARIVPVALLLAAGARAAAAVPELNGHWLGRGFSPAADVDLGVVVSLKGGGLLVPVIRGAHRLPVTDLMAALRDLVARARRGRLTGADLAEPSITVTNLGDQGVDTVHGVIHPPQVALLGFGRVADRPWAVEGLLGVRPVVTVTLAADHRATDADTGARMLRVLADLLADPEALDAPVDDPRPRDDAPAPTPTSDTTHPHPHQEEARHES